MEGTKHEKAVLVVLSYIVGLTSGFIGFGLTERTLDSQPPQIRVAYEEVATVPDEMEVQPQVELSQSEGVIVAYTDGRLTVDVNGSVQLLSVERSRLNLEAASYFTKQGMHMVEPVFALSLDSKFVFFCEQASTKDLCQAFVYDIKNETIHYVTANGTKLQLTNTDAQQSMWAGTQLISGQYSSDNADTPWNLATK